MAIDIIYEATYLRHGKQDTVSFYNQSFTEIGRQLDVLNNVYGLKIIKIKRTERKSTLLD